MTFKNKFASEYTSQFKEHSAIELVKQFKSGKTSISEYLTKLFNHIEKMNPELNALTSIQKEHAFERAKQLEAQKVNNE